jgi:DNA gyrase inhibitor GyrI
MYLPVPSRPDCFSAWREAVRLVDAEPGHQAYNVIIDIEHPTARASMADPAVAAVSAFLSDHEKKPIETVANTIFPAGLYTRYRAPDFFDRFREDVLPKVRRSGPWSGYYFERMMQLPQLEGGPINQLWEIVERLRNPNVRALNKFELSIFDPARDVNDSPYGGQCLSFASMKLVGKPDARRLSMTAFYRNHFYIEKLLGNLVGLGRLLNFLASEGGVGLGSLTVVSTHAEIDMAKWGRNDLIALLSQCDQASAQLAVAA